MNENINTIFYFPSTLTFEQYQNKLQSQEITPRTIVFAAAQNAIYMGGIEYGAVVPQSKVVPFVEPYQYDDSNLREQLAALDTALQAANRTAADQYAANQAFMNGIGATIQARIQELLANKDWTDGHLPSGSNFGQQEVESYLQRLGVWGENETHDKAHATWTEIAQTVDAISLSVSQLYDSGELTQGFKQAIVDIAIGDTVKTEIGSYIATNYIEDLDTQGNKIIKVLEWLYSGMTSETSANSTFANLYSNAQIGTNSALSKISTAVEKVKDATGNFTNDLISTTTITSQVNDSLATLKQSAGNNFVKTEIIGKIDQTNADIASIISEITGDSSNTTIANKISTWKSGLVTSATLDGATADLLSSNDSNSLKSGLITFVKNNAAQAELVAANDFTSASVVALVNGAGSSININADKINLTGQTNFTSALADVFTGKKFYATSDTIGDSVSGVKFCELIDAANGFTIGVKSVANADTPSSTWTAKYYHVNSTGEFELGNGAITGNVSSNGLVTIGSASRRVKLDGHVEVADDFKVHALEAELSSGSNDDSKIVVGSNGLSIYGPDGTSLIHSLNKTIEFKIGGANGISYGNGANITIGRSVDVTGDITYTGQSIQSSDERLKDIQSNIEANINDIANVRLVNYTYKNDENEVVRPGTIAQDWQNIVPNAVVEHNDYLSLDYSAISIVSAVTAAREIVALKAENAQLKSRLDAIEARLNA